MGINNSYKLEHKRLKSFLCIYCDFFYSSYDESLWQKINVYYKKVPGDFIVHVLTKGKIIHPKYYKY